MAGRFLAGMGAAAATSSVAGWLGGGRAALTVVCLAMTILLPYAALIQWRDFKAGAMRHGPGLTWHVTRKRNPFRFWMVSIVGLELVPIGIAMMGFLWWSILWGNWK
ncbi:MAG: hypothetical protein ACO25F_11595 [Erythrobacter sp.]